MKPVTAKPPVAKDEEDDQIIIDRMRRECRRNTLIAAALGIVVGFVLGAVLL